MVLIDAMQRAREQKNISDAKNLLVNCSLYRNFFFGDSKRFWRVGARSTPPKTKEGTMQVREAHDPPT
jgi:hypothetical protein